jgi:hypothetical protein
VISDGANEDLPLDFDGLISEDGKLLAGRMAARIAAAPWRVVGLLRLQRRCARAARRLAETLCQALGELGEATR